MAGHAVPLLDAMQAELTGSFHLCRGVMGLSNVRRVRCRTADEALQLLAVVRPCPSHLIREAALYVYKEGLPGLLRSDAHLHPMDPATALCKSLLLSNFMCPNLLQPDDGP